MFSPISISGVGGGWVHQLEPKCHFDLFHSWWGGYISNFSCIQLFHSWWGGGYISQNQNVTLMHPTFPFLGGGTSARTKMYFDLYPTFLIPVGGYIGNFFEFSNFFKSFHTNVAQNHPQLQIWPKKWLRLGQNGQIWSFCRIFYLFPQNEAEIDLEWSISPDSQLFPSFSTKASHFWRNPKNFHF